MKKFAFGLVLGLIVGFLGVLAYLLTVGKPEPTFLDEASLPDRPRNIRSPDTEVALQAARLRLKSFVDGKPDRRRAILDFLDAVVFDRDWHGVQACSEALRELPREGGVATPEFRPSPEASEVAPLSPLLARQQLEHGLFWTRLERRKNPATALRLKADEAERLLELQKLLRAPALRPNELQTRRDALRLLALEGDPGLRILIDEVGRSDVSDIEVVLEGIARSGHPRAAGVLARLTSPERSLEVRLGALEALPLVADFVAGLSSEANEALVRLAAAGQEPALRDAAVAASGQTDLSVAAGPRELLEALLASPTEPAQLRLKALQSLTWQAEHALALPLTTRRALDGFVRAERDPALRQAAFEAIALGGDEESLLALRDARGTTQDPQALSALEEAERALKLRTGVE